MKLNISLNSLLIALILSLISFSVRAQSVFIQNISIIPSTPIENDSIFLIITSSFSSGPCPQTNHNVVIDSSTNTISIQSSHSLGPFTYICISTDTIIIGILPSGMYSLNYVTTIPNSSATDSLNFIVSSSTGINNTFSDLNIYPNPASNILTIELNSTHKINTVELLDINGKHIHSLMPVSQKSIPKQFSYGISKIKNGIYYLKINFDNGLLFKKLVIQN